MALPSFGGGGGKASSGVPFWEKVGAVKSAPPPAVAAPNPPPRYSPAPSAPAPAPAPAPDPAARNWIAGATAPREPAAPDAFYMPFLQLMEDMRREYESQQGDSIRREPGDPWNSRAWPPAPMPTIPELDTGQSMPIQGEGQNAVSGLMSIPLVNQIAPFILAMVETAAGAPPGTYDANRPDVPAPTPGPSSGLTGTDPSSYENRAWPTQEEVAQQPAPTGPRRTIREEVWDAIVNAGGEPGKADDIERANAALEKRDAARAQAQRAIDLRRERGKGPLGLTFDPNSTSPFKREPGVDLFGGTGARDEALARSMDAAGARYAGAADQYEAQQKIKEGRDKNRKEKIVEITLDEWNAMTPSQQNAIRFNTDLVAAVQTDKANQDTYAPTTEEKLAYDSILRDVFGTTESTAPEGIEYAPQTAALLQNLDVLPAQDLGTFDDFLKLDVAITAKQVERIEESLGRGPDHLTTNELTPSQERLARAQALTQAQSRITETLTGELERGKRLLSGMSADKITADAAALGGLEEEAKPQLEQAEADAVSLFMGFMADPENDLMEAAAALDSAMVDKGFDENSQQKIRDAMANSIVEGVTGGIWFDDVREQGSKVRQPQQIAQALGIPVQKVG